MTDPKLMEPMPLPEPDGTAEIDHGPAPGGGREGNTHEPLKPPVTLGDLMSRHLPRDAEECRFMVRISNPGGLTAHQTVDACDVSFGFDWEARQIVVTPAKPLTTLTPEQLAEVAASVKNGQSWHAYEAHKRREAKWQEKLTAAISQARRDAMEECAKVSVQLAKRDRDGYDIAAAIRAMAKGEG